MKYFEKKSMYFMGFIIFAMLFVLKNNSAFANSFFDEKKCIRVDADLSGSTYTAGFDIDFVSENGSKLVKNVYKDNNLLVSMDYNEYGLRSKKVGKDVSLFEYFYPEYQDTTGAILSREIRNGKEISYFNDYFPDEGLYLYTGFSFEDEEYGYVWNTNENGHRNFIRGITDSSGNVIVRYVYDFEVGNGEACSVIYIFEKNESGKWIENTNNNSIGYLNKIRYTGYYEDDETRWHYSSGIYDFNGVIGLYDIDHFEYDTTAATDVKISPLGYESEDLEAEQLADSYLNTPSYNTAKKSDYYKTASTVEIIARMLYGECSSNLVDQTAVSWIVLNRYHVGTFGNTIRDIVADPIQFNGVTNNNGLKAKSSSDTAWRIATYYACLMTLNDSEACWNSLAAKPRGISNQLYFRAGRYLGASNGIYESNGKLYVYYKNGSDRAISNAAIAGKGTSKTVSGLEALCTNGKKKYNVFFYHP
ncbi:MAG: cell wall hydrolase [Lachnospiraceae bacterium]|nr:cell wall hydrolase [Lachnospiraceae bacterium]